MPNILIYTLLVMVAVFFFLPLLTSIVKIALFAAVIGVGYWAVTRFLGDK